MVCWAWAHDGADQTIPHVVVADFETGGYGGFGHHGVVVDVHHGCQNWAQTPYVPKIQNFLDIE